MRDRIVQIETYKSPSNRISFAGTLRNEKEFELFQNVFIESGGAMYQCKVVGIELPPNDNPEYIYRIELPEDLIEKREGQDFIPDSEKSRMSLTCKRIFSSIEEAKESALEEIEHKYKLNKEFVENFFKRYE